jgi:hypothetical protein
MRHPIPEDIGDYLKVDSASSTGLRWLKTVNSRAKEGEEAGCKWIVPGRERENYSVRFRNTLYLNARIIFFLETGIDPKNLEVDHKNRISICNDKNNLRLATRSENQRNKNIQKNNTSGYKGVCWDKIRNKWKSAIHVNGKIINLGRFFTKEEAAIAYNEAAVKYFGEFAYLNVIPHKYCHQPEQRPNPPA